MKLVFITGTRADYGKLKPLIGICDECSDIEAHIYVTGMHLLSEYGFTCNDILADGYSNIYVPPNFTYSDLMDVNLAHTILEFSGYIKRTNPDLIIIHGDRIEPLAAATVGVLNNIKVAHVEGGEVTGTADEFMRHAISKLSSLHFVANEESKLRLIQLGERAFDVHVIGSPDIDIMLSETLSEIKKVKKQYLISYNEYAIFIYHPVTTSNNLQVEVEQVVSAAIGSGKNYIVIAPNNDNGSDVIRCELRRFIGNSKFMQFKSIVFEDFLVLLQHCEFIIGNSSAGIREACVYGIPAIDIGSRQNKRYAPEVLKNIQHVNECSEDIIAAIRRIGKYKYTSQYFGDGKSAERFLEIILKTDFTQPCTQKSFVELDVTSDAIKNYINEVCF